MKILIIGSGGREHAMAASLALSENVEKIYTAPGNGGTAREAKCENIDTYDPATPQGQGLLAAFAKEHAIDLCIVGPEVPLANGIVDVFRPAGVPIVGPASQAAKLEASKAFAKEFMTTYGVRCAKSNSVYTIDEALRYAVAHFAQPETAQKPLVIKADGLAAGKGVVIVQTYDEAVDTIYLLRQEKTWGSAGSILVLEEFLEGREVSVLAAVSVLPGKQAVIRPFVAARDHKRRFDGDKGPNTGGMGAIAPVPDFTPELQEDFRKAILDPTLHGLVDSKMDYRGFIFFGLMIQDNRCYLLEYNVRLGDPEAQAVLPLLQSDFAELCLSIEENRLEDFPLAWKSGAVCVPVAVADGYPFTYKTGNPIEIDQAGLDSVHAKLFAAGLKQDTDGALVTSGGRVFALSCYGDNAVQARERAYTALTKVHFEGLSFRKDIGL
ncbi:phosphoribosylamine--glycine ligase [Breznakiellaceae bacterium SP9]